MLCEFRIIWTDKCFVSFSSSKSFCNVFHCFKKFLLHVCCFDLTCSFTLLTKALSRTASLSLREHKLCLCAIVRKFTISMEYVERYECSPMNSGINLLILLLNVYWVHHIIQEYEVHHTLQKPHSISVQVIVCTSILVFTWQVYRCLHQLSLLTVCPSHYFKSECLL